ncbi:MAG TPA: copper-containing nitrite reductase [Anaerolineales bacterium]|nr:copper-containing nitrite reductase [Anaerolineales bacterium]
MELISYLWEYIVEAFGLIIAYGFAAIFIFLVLRQFHSWRITAALAAIFIGVSIAFYLPNGVPTTLAYPLSLESYGPGESPNLPFRNALHFFQNFNNFERVSDIARNPTDVPQTIVYAEEGVVEVNLTTTEVIAEMADGTTINYWTFDNTVPGPFIRVRQGDTVRLTIHNDETSLHPHNIDFHAATGPGGGAAATIVAPGESKTFSFKALNAGLFVYHCAFGNAGLHMTHGMYGLILVEPEGGLPAVDKEFYVMQGEFYTEGGMGRDGLQLFDTQAYLDGQPQYVVFNGRTGALMENMNANVGETVRIYVGNGGVNLVSSFHVIGEIFDRVYREGDLINPPAEGLQTTLVPAGGAAMVEFQVDYPGSFVLVDHALARVDRGAWGMLHVEGEADPTIYDGEIQSGNGH